MARSTPTSLLALAALALSLAACGAEPPPPAHEPIDVSFGPSRAHEAAAPAAMGKGSSDGVSCEEAIAGNNDEIGIGKKGEAGPKDLSAADLGAVLNHGHYLEACNVPSSTKVEVCAAVKNGAAVGVTVSMSPADAELEGCVAKAVRALAFPAHPKMDVARTSF